MVEILFYSGLVVCGSVVGFYLGRLSGYILLGDRLVKCVEVKPELIHSVGYVGCYSSHREECSDR